MGTNKLWEFSVPSTCIAEGGVKLIYPGGDAWLLFDYYDENRNDTVFNTGIVFDDVQAHRHSSEKFLKSLLGAYDTLVEITDSEWVTQLREVNRGIADYWNIKPPETLYHGTAKRFIQSINENGLLPQNRQYVHLSVDTETALQVGKRRDNEPTLLRVQALRAWTEGVKFYLGNDKVWLADTIPSKYISFE